MAGPGHRPSPPPLLPGAQGDEAFHCEKCRAKTPATKHLRLHRLPQILVLHIKRFKYRGFFTDKLTASVSYPLAGLSLDAFLSPETLAGGAAGAAYDLYAVSNHYGNLTGGHYTAMARSLGAGTPGDWYCFNDEVVNRVSDDQVRRLAWRGLATPARSWGCVPGAWQDFDMPPRPGPGRGGGRASRVHARGLSRGRGPGGGARLMLMPPPLPSPSPQPRPQPHPQVMSQYAYILFYARRPSA